jgi:hypothetical protein
VWPIQLADRLPIIPVPLLEPDADVELDLQHALNGVYDAVGYDLILDYGSPPHISLSMEEAAWTERRLRESNQ